MPPLTQAHRAALAALRALVYAELHAATLAHQREPWPATTYPSMRLAVAAARWEGVQAACLALGYTPAGPGDHARE